MLVLLGRILDQFSLSSGEKEQMKKMLLTADAHPIDSHPVMIEQRLDRDLPSNRHSAATADMPQSAHIHRGLS